MPVTSSGSGEGRMTVHFIGAGPGAADLVTVRAPRLIASSPVCLYAGALVPRELLDTARRAPGWSTPPTSTWTRSPPSWSPRTRPGSTSPGCTPATRRCTARWPSRCAGWTPPGCPTTSSPGVPAFAAAAASLRRELTVPGVAQTVVLTRTSARATPMPPGEDLADLGRHRRHAGAAPRRAAARRAGRRSSCPHYGADCPVAVVARASRDDELVLRGTLADIAAQVTTAGIRRTAVIVVGRVLTAERVPRQPPLLGETGCRRERSRAADDDPRRGR